MGEPGQAVNTAAAPAAAQPIVVVRNLVVAYTKGVDIVRGTSLTVGDREFVCILGPNGAGKSTLIKAVFGLVKPHSGSVTIHGVDMTGAPTHRLVKSGVGYVPQVGDVFADLSVEDNLRMGAFTSRRLFARHRDRVFDWFPVLAGKRREAAGSMSGGQRRLLGIARALMTDPTVLLLDEPSAGLSPANVRVVFDRISKIRDEGVAIAMVEQNAVEGLRVADTGYILDQGREAIQGPADSLLTDPRVRELYLGLRTA